MWQCRSSIPPNDALQTDAPQEPDILRFHPCYSEIAHTQYGRIHLPVAPRCNIHCNYCDRRIGDCYHSVRPGVAERVMTPEEAVGWVSRALEAEPRLRVVGIAGPGEPLANAATFRTLDLVARHVPHLMRCLSTNGLLLSQYAPELARLGVHTVTVTVNALSPQVAARIYAWVEDNAAGIGARAPRIQRGEAGAVRLVARQLAGIARASALGMAVKVNTVLIPGVNEDEVGPVARVARSRGAVIQNIMPLIPLGNFRNLRPPTCEELEASREIGGAFLPQFRRCRQCRADAVGVPGEGH